MKKFFKKFLNGVIYAAATWIGLTLFQPAVFLIKSVMARAAYSLATPGIAFLAGCVGYSRGDGD